MRRGAIVLLLLSSIQLGGTARADVPLPQDARLRPRIGWICARWTRRVSGDLNGDGSPDQALLYERTAPRSSCDESALPSRWWVTVFLGRDGRFDERVTFDTAPSICALTTAYLNADGPPDLLVTIDGGVTFTVQATVDPSFVLYSNYLQAQAQAPSAAPGI